MSREILKDAAAEKTTQKISAILKDESDVVIPLAQVGALTLTLYNEETGTVINSRNAQDVLNTNGGTLHATTGALTMLLGETDTAMEDTTKSMETRVALFQWTFASTKKGKHEVVFYVRNLAKVT